jgi:hypothetical protein
MSNITLTSQEETRSPSEFAAEAFDKLVIALTGVLAMIALLAVA